MPSRRRTGSPKVAVAYIRCSKEDQALSPDAQRAAIETWAKATGITVASWHVDAGFSGGSDIEARPALAEAIAALRAVGAGVLAVARRDRLARDVSIAAAVDRAVAQSGARVVSADGTANGDSPADTFMRVILDAASAYERDLLRARTRAALQAKRRQGLRAGGIPYGFVADATGRLMPNETERAVIARARQLRGEGLSQRAIVARLAAEGHASRRGTALGIVQVQRMLAGSEKAAA